MGEELLRGTTLNVYHGGSGASGATWQAQVFRDKSSGEEQLALVHGAIDTSKSVVVRMHSLDLFADVLGEAADGSGRLHGAKGSGGACQAGRATASTSAAAAAALSIAA